MKKNLSIFYVFLILLMAGTKAQSQITLEHTIDSTLYGYTFYPAKISNTETKYVFLDTATNTFDIYNLDFSPFMTNISVPHSLNNGNSYFYFILYLSRTLFDCDSSNIEYMFTAQNEPGQQLWIMRTDGTVLFHADSTRGPYCLGCPGGTSLLRPILVTENGTKMILMKDNFAAGRAISIYSICGTPPDPVYEIPNEGLNYLDIYPNPASMQINFNFHPRDNLNNYELDILNNNSQLLKKIKLGNSDKIFDFNVRDFSNGIYYFSLSAKNNVLQTGSFIISK
ncbi:MAG: T9SS type A sorting domain-containing protein [Bacteroidota bacterium]